MDYTNMSLTQAKRLEMESQVRKQAGGGEGGEGEEEEEEEGEEEGEEVEKLESWGGEIGKNLKEDLKRKENFEEN